MHGYDFGPSYYGMFAGGPVMWILWIAVIALVVWLGRRLTGRPGGARPSDARGMLEEEYSRGDIGRDEYLQKLADLKRA
jgi:putative membrane protein